MADIVWPHGTDDFLKERLAEGAYEEHQLQLVGDYVTPEHRVLEGGAGVGVVSRLLSERAGFVISFEGNKELMEAAERNAPRAFVLWGQLGSGGVDTGDGFGVEQGRTAPVVPPDLAIHYHDLNTIVLDIEGAEVDVLMRANLDPVVLIIFEWHEDMVEDGSREQVEKRLTSEGFERAECLLDGSLSHEVWKKVT